MSKLLKGNVNYTVFKPSRQADSITDIRESVSAFLFQILKPEDIRDESAGWVDPLLSFDTENMNNILMGDSLILGLRIDKYSFGAAQMRPYLEEAEFSFKNANNLEYLSSQQKKEIKEGVIKTLRMNSYPKTTIVEVCWNFSNGLVYLFSQSGAILTKFIDIFEKTFELNLEPVSMDDVIKKMPNPDSLEPLLGKIWRVE
jgi:recombination associated protein RdgC